MTGKTTKAVMAIFAVALMMMVAFVPAISVLTDDGSDAATTVTIKGTVYLADGSGTVADGTKVYIDGTELYGTTTSGAYTINNVPVGTVVVKVDVSKWTVGTNKVEGWVFPSVTVTSTGSMEKIVNFTANTVLIKGVLKDAGTATLQLVDVTISGAEGTVKTTSAGYEFYGTAGKTYNLSASTAGYSFSGSGTAGTGTTTIDLTSTQYTLSGSSFVPFGTLSATTVTSGKTAVISLASTSPAFVGSGIPYTYYVGITFAAAAADKSDVDVNMTFGNGIAQPTKVTIAADTIASNQTGKDLAAANVYYGKAIASAGFELTSFSAVLSGKDANGVAGTVSGKIVNGYYYLGANVSATSVLTTDIKLTVTDSAAAYKFNVNAAPAVGNYDFTSYNAVLVSGTAFLANGTTAVNGVVITVTATNALGLKDGKITTANDGSNDGVYKFCVPRGASVTLAAGDLYSPASYAFTASYGITNANFTANGDVTYTGKVLLNGVGINMGANLQYSVNNGTSYTNLDATNNWKTAADGSAYYVISASVASASKLLVRVVDTPATNYTYNFGDKVNDHYPAVAVGTDGKFADISVQKSNVTATVKATTPTDFVLAGTTVSFVMVSGASYDVNNIVAQLGTAVADKDGKAVLSTGIPAKDSTDYTIFAIADGKSTFGNFTAPAANNATSTGTFKDTVSSVAITSTDKVTSGYYTANGSELSGFALSYKASAGTVINTYGSAKIIGDKYYIITATAVDKIEVVPTDVKKFTFSDETIVYKTLGTIGGQSNIAVVATNVVTGVTFNYTTAGIPEWASVTVVDSKMMISAGYFKVGAVFALNADEKHIIELNGGAQYDYSDVKETYTFKCWKITADDGTVTELKDAHTSYTLKTNAVVEVCYDVDTQVLSESVKSPSNSVDQTVLILGIAAVIIALLAVVYAVMQIKKKD